MLAIMVSGQGLAISDKISFIESAIEKVIETGDPTAQVGIMAVSLNGSETYEKNSDKRYVPGSSLKLFVAVAALDLLGFNYQFETQIVTDGTISKGELDGNCYILASGDPSLGIAGLEELVHAIKSKGVNRIKGNLILDVSVFDHVELGPGWMWDEEPNFWCSPLSALNVEHNCVVFEVQPGQKLGSPCCVRLYPECEKIVIVNSSKTIKSGNTLRMHRLNDGRFEVVGMMGFDDQPQICRLPVRVPHVFAGEVLKKIFIKNQIQFEGKVKLGTCLKRVTQLGVHRSAKLGELMKTVLKNSDNLYADAIFKKLGQARYGSPGSWEKGSKAIREFLEKKVGLDAHEMIILDGCGASRYNLISPKQMVAFLKWIHESFAYGKDLKNALAIGGIDGTLRKRMTAPQLIAKVRAKSGTMTGVSALCGFIKDDVAFAIFVNGYVKSSREIKGKIEDAICHVLINSLL